ncbi:MAG: outer membrane beta-barrel protein [Legionellales bacterium]|jgi:opacity protein-like surface antigen
MRTTYYQRGLIFLLLPCSMAFAEDSGWWVSVEGGYGFAIEESHTNTVPMPNDPLPPLYDDYQTNDREGGFIVGATGGYQFALNEEDDEDESSWFPTARLGIGYEYVGSTDVNGQVIKYQEKPYYDYQYDVSAQVIWLDGQIDLFDWCNFSPFIDAGIGIAFNRMSDYEENRINTEVPVRESADFSDETNTEFAWRAGVGVNYTIPEQDDAWTISVLTRYSDLGDAQTGSSQTYPTVGSISSELVNIELLLALRYNFD